LNGSFLAEDRYALKRAIAGSTLLKKCYRETHRGHANFREILTITYLWKVQADQAGKKVEIGVIVRDAKSPKLVRRRFLLFVKFFCETMLPQWGLLTDRKRKNAAGFLYPQA
jgi:hypothetical protein